MPDYFPAFAAELKAVVKTLWSLTDATYFTSIQAMQQNIVVSIDSGDLGVPFGVVILGELRPERESGVAAKAKRAPVEAWYVTQTEDRGAVSNQDFVHGKLYTLADFIDSAVPNETAGVTTFQSWDEEATIDSGSRNVANALFLESGIKLIAGVVKWEQGLLVGEI